MTINSDIFFVHMVELSYAWKQYSYSNIERIFSTVLYKFSWCAQSHIRNGDSTLCEDTFGLYLLLSTG